MNKKKRHAVLGCVLSIVFAVLYGAVGFALLGGRGEAPFLRFAYLFCFIALPGVLVVTLIAVIKL